MQKIGPEEVVRYILDHPATIIWYKEYITGKTGKPFFTEVYSKDFAEKGVAVDLVTVNWSRKIMILVPVKTSLGIRGSEVVLTDPRRVLWMGGDIPFLGNWMFYAKWAWYVAQTPRHPLNKYVRKKMREEGV
ncbi:hypothetical protein c131 [Metallosphaera turreted icosahedral virus]|nr:hypothetical protein c131 [Metallosphaera turreted icosahedral virus]